MNIIKTKDGKYKIIKYIKKDFRVNSSPTGNNEVIKFNKSIYVPKIDLEFKNIHDLIKYIEYNTKTLNYTKGIKPANNKRIFKKSEDNTLILNCKEDPKTGEITQIELTQEIINKINYNRYKSEKRAKKAFYDYALSNKWQYFATFTFKNENQRNSKKEIKKLWNYFKTKLQNINKNVRIISTIEQHKKGGYHLHALIDNINIDNYLTIARNPHNNEIIRDSLNNIIFNVSLWTAGYSTVSLIPQDPDTQSKVINYLIKYVTKSPCANYLEKRFLKTRNLEKRPYYLGDTSNEIENIKFKNELLTKYKYKEIKDKEGNTVLEIFKERRKN